MFLAGDQNQAYYSPDGKTWLPRPGIPFPFPTNGSEWAPSLTYFGGRWLARQEGGVAVSNADASSWQTVLTLEDPQGPYSGFTATRTAVYTYEPVAGGVNYFRSENGVNWENIGFLSGAVSRQMDSWWYRSTREEFPARGFLIEMRLDPVAEEPLFIDGPYETQVTLETTGRRFTTRASNYWGGVYQAGPGTPSFVHTSEWPDFSSLVENSVAAVGRVAGAPGHLLRARADLGFANWVPVSGPPPNNVELFGNQFIISDVNAVWVSDDGLEWQRHEAPAGFSDFFAGHRRWPVFFRRDAGGSVISTVDGKAWVSVGHIAQNSYLWNSAWNGIYPGVKGGGFWPYRQRQSLGASGYPYRQRQNGGNTGSYPYRQRQRGL